MSGLLLQPLYNSNRRLNSEMPNSRARRGARRAAAVCAHQIMYINFGALIIPASDILNTQSVFDFIIYYNKICILEFDFRVVVLSLSELLHVI